MLLLNWISCGKRTKYFAVSICFLGSIPIYFQLKNVIYETGRKWMKLSVLQNNFSLKVEGKVSHLPKVAILSHSLKQWNNECCVQRGLSDINEKSNSCNAAISWEGNDEGYHYCPDIFRSTLVTGQIFENRKMINIILFFHKGGYIYIYIRLILNTAWECWENILSVSEMIGFGGRPSLAL